MWAALSNLMLRPFLHSLRVLLAVVAGMGGLVFFTGCASSSASPGPRAESSIPWNRPAKWEGPGALGGGMPSTN